MKVHIKSDGTGQGTSVTSVETGKPVDGAYAFEISGSRLTCATKATVFCHNASVDVVTEADIVETAALRKRAKQIAEEMDVPEVAIAFDRLFGFPVPFK